MYSYNGKSITSSEVEVLYTLTIDKIEPGENIIEFTVIFGEGE